MKKDTQTIARELQEHLARYNRHYEIMPTIGGKEITVFINWGDWKHDHRCFLNILSEFFTARGVSDDKLMIDRRVTEENGTDCYSAEYYIEVA